MKLRLLSDLHLEMNNYLYKHMGEDVLVLAGDIHTRNRHHDILNRVPETVQILMVAGNHEYYRGVFEDVNAYLASLQQTYPNFTFLNNSNAIVNGIPVYGGTMYTDFKLTGDPLSEFDAMRNIHDYELTRVGVAGGETRKWTTNDHKEEHEKFCRGLKFFLANTDGAKKRIVVSHFVPSIQLSHPRWRMSNLNPYFVSDMTRFMGWDGLWLCGHTHDCGNGRVGDTELWCNPYGYRNGRENPEFNNNFILEI